MPSEWITLIAGVLAFSLAGAAAQAQHDGHAAPAADADADTDAGDADALFSAGDLQFLHHMIVHHEQAVVMSALVPERSDRDAFRQFARYVSRAQAKEIDMMQSLLDLAADRALDVPTHALTGDPPMAGMLSSAQMAALEAASGPEFERLWLEGMIYHHQGAIDMSHAQQRRQLASGRRPYALDVLVEDIVVEQRAEIAKMEAWLDDWDLRN